MRCGEVQLLIHDCVDNSLDEKKEKAIKEHFANCGNCHEDFEQIVKLKALLCGLSVEEPDSKYFDEMTASIISKTSSD